jgi:RNA polymerase sigma factor (sigma-70 family)
MGRMAGSGEDGALVAAFREGRDGAFDRIVRRHYAGMIRLAERRCGTGALADDAVQAALVRAHRYLRGSGPVENLGAWLRRVVHNCAMDLLRAERRERTGLDLAGDVEAPAPAVTAESRELRAMVAAAIDRLPEIYREPLRLCYLEGVEAREIAERLRDNVHSVKSRIARGRHELRRRLEHVLIREGYL